MGREANVDLTQLNLNIDELEASSWISSWCFGESRNDHTYHGLRSPTSAGANAICERDLEDTVTMCADLS